MTGCSVGVLDPRTSRVDTVTPVAKGGWTHPNHNYIDKSLLARIRGEQEGAGPEKRCCQRQQRPSCDWIEGEPSLRDKRWMLKSPLPHLCSHFLKSQLYRASRSARTGRYPYLPQKDEAGHIDQLCRSPSGQALIWVYGSRSTLRRRIQSLRRSQLPTGLIMDSNRATSQPTATTQCYRYVDCLFTTSVTGLRARKRHHCINK